MKPMEESLLQNAAKETPEVEPVTETDGGAREASFGVNKGDDVSKPHSHSADHLKSVRSAREQLDLEPSRQNSHACRVELVVKLMETDVNTGLTAAEAAARLEKYGLNKLADPVAETLLQRLWRQINQILIWILLVACIVSGAVQSWPEFGLIIAVVIINVLLGVIQEGKASKATAALKNMLSSKATVIRDGNRMEIEATQVVPGDVIFMESGNKVPADVRLFQVSNLQVQEAMLTGESLPVSKVTKAVSLQVGLGDRKNMCYSATLVVKGQGTGVCVATGDTTEIGRIAELVSEVKETKTNLLKQIDAFGRWIGMVVLPIALATFLIALLTPVDLSNSGDTPVNATATNSSNNKAQQSFIIAVAIAVSMIPAGLPAIITICLAIATTYMAKQNAIVKTLPSVETLGSVMVICSDKTGTLTKNEMTVVAARTQARKYNVAGVGYDPAEGTVQGEDGADPAKDEAFKALIRGGTLNNESRIERTEEGGRKFVAPIGDPSECALCCVAEKSKMDLAAIKSDYPRVGVIPFESEHKFMVTFHKDPQDDRSYLAIVKGAPDRLAAKSSQSLQEDGTEAPMDLAFWNEQVTALSSNGYRCLAVCQTKISAVSLPEVLAQGAAWVYKADAPFLTYVGLVAILDPPREECITAIKEAHRAGIIVKMITGDHPATAKSIGKQLGIVDEEHTQVLTGPELDRMSIEDLEKVVVGCNVFARASPDNKISIVRALQNQKKVCSMTGDGVNDAPALRAADIGVAMGITGSDVSKDAAKIILTDDNFATILVAVREGRRVWDNLRKILLFNMPANFAQGGVIFIAVCLQWPVVPLTAIQVLYVNMITACTLGLIFCIEPAESTVMDRPPRRLNKGLIGSFFYWRNIYVTSIFITFVLGSVSWIKAMDPVKYGATAQRAIAFNCLVFCEIGYAMSCRFLKLSSIHPRVFKGNPAAWVCAIFMGGLNVMVTYVPGLNSFFSMSAMDGPQWGIVFLFAVCAFLLVELEKALSDPLRPYTRPIVVAFQSCFAKIPSCPSFSRIWNCTKCCDVEQKEKPREPVDPATRQGGSMRAVPESELEKINSASTPAAVPETEAVKKNDS